MPRSSAGLAENSSVGTRFLLAEQPKTVLASLVEGVADLGLTLSDGQAAACRKNGLDVRIQNCLEVTPEDFGTQSEPPTHPQLIDWLACELIESGWDTNHIHRLILLSSTYQQSSKLSPENAAIDPDNKLYWRWTPRRLEAEAIRDSMLYVSGQLQTFAGGPSRPKDSLCRSVYLVQKRANLPDQQLLFDSAQGIVSCSRRRVSTSPLQPLWLLNSDFSQQAARKLAQRAGSLQQAIRLAFGRKATADELETLESLADEFGLPSACLTLLNTHEFLYIP